ncbi:unnamed protein product [Bursaphelenchus okinawaensis]|uniref:Nuclear receptor domain-containing protein n=1 Tax=Bursaphelenchus okinawaensis TaxID=465554 RepID=A0A811L7N8_9BILA|nr:unnamed protein product [Bursaphelenchus okinawaensis]CAG9117530.1 unnamed protein product [Bursaphelenchus okinawaensis]
MSSCDDSSSTRHNNASSPENSPKIVLVRPKRLKRKLFCEVCNGETLSRHLDAQVCRACAAFYKRSVIEKLIFQCANNSSCKMEFGNLRHCCRACRFEKCKTVGAYYSLNAQPKTKIEVAAKLGIESTVLPNRLLKLAEGYEYFLANQHKLLVEERGDCSPTKIRVQRKKAQDLEIKSLPFMIRMINDFFGPVNALPCKSKIKLLNAAHSDLMLLRQYALTLDQFPECGDTRCMLTTGYYADSIDLDYEWFLDGFFKKDNLKMYLEVSLPYLHKTMDIMNEFRRHKTNRTDFVVLMLLALYKHADALNLSTEEMRIYKDEVLNEWSYSYFEKHGQTKMTNHLVQIMKLYVEVDRV